MVAGVPRAGTAAGKLTATVLPSTSTVSIAPTLVMFTMMVSDHGPVRVRLLRRIPPSNHSSRAATPASEPDQVTV